MPAHPTPEEPARPGWWVGAVILLVGGPLLVWSSWAAIEMNDIEWTFFFWVPLLILPTSLAATIGGCIALYSAFRGKPTRK